MKAQGLFGLLPSYVVNLSCDLVAGWSLSLNEEFSNTGSAELLQRIDKKINNEKLNIGEIVVAFTASRIAILESVDFKVRFHPSNTFSKFLEMMNQCLTRTRIFI